MKENAGWLVELKECGDENILYFTHPETTRKFKENQFLDKLIG